ncbi:MAG: bifunctional riboflavin kinase/FAD synthetase [Candidatus Gastranaerophilaceae bacterium]
MQVFNEINKNKGFSLAFGFFDGVHIGHQAVIKSAVNYAKKNGCKSAIITFQDHPCCFFYHVKPKYLIRKHDKIKFFEDLGVDYLYFLKFDEYLAMMDASEYLKDVIIKNFAPSAISTGFNYFFGAKKSGDVNYLKKMQEELNYKYFETPPVLYDSEIVSSTRIREDLTLGNVELVNSMLGYEYFLEETVIEGEKLGGELGFKTANLVYPDNLVEIGRGVYKVRAEYNGKSFDAIANYGIRPTIGNKETPILEVHILNFDKNIYGEKIKVTFLKKIRDEKKFHSLDELKEQIRQDISSTK